MVYDTKGGYSITSGTTQEIDWEARARAIAKAFAYLSIQTGVVGGQAIANSSAMSDKAVEDVFERFRQNAHPAFKLGWL